MTQVRQWLLGLASSSAFYSGVVPALGLGEITLHSALNQPLEAEIELLQVADLSAGDLSVRLAPADVFARSGVERLMFLNDLRFTPLLRGDTSVIRVVSNQPVREPYLNFIVEVARPNGQLLREYTVLLDPPGSSAYRTLASVPSTPAPAPVARATAPVAAPRTAAPVAEQGRRYQVASGDSLWKIAARLRATGSQAGQQALMRDIQALNPQAFSNGDSNRLRAGVELVLPDAAGAAVVALESPLGPAAADSQAPVPSAPAAPLDEPIDVIDQAQQRVDQALAEQATENAQLQQGLAELQLQVQQLQAQMAEKDRQLAELQARLDERQAAAQPLAAPPATVVEQPRATPGREPASAESGGWLYAGYAALALLLAAVLGLAWRGRRRAEAVQQPARVDRQASESVEAAAPSSQPSPPPAMVPVRAASKLPPSPPFVQPAASSDALEGANIYIAYGRLGEAAAALRKALQEQPQRSDIRFRLLEVLAQQGDSQAFGREEAVLRADGFPSARIDQLKARHPLPVADALEAAVLELDEPVAQSPAEGLVDDDFQLNLDDLSLDADWDLVSPFATGGGSKAAAPAEDPGLARDPRNPFAESMLVEETTADGWAQDELRESFDARPDIDGDAFPADLDQLAGSRDNLARLNLALAYIEQGNLGSACDILNQVISDGDDQQKREARKLLAKIA